jgi:formate/nitrite transporter FocA (FNT family)
MTRKPPAKNGKPKLSSAEKEDVEERVRLPTPVVYEIVRKEGAVELARPASALLWSGVAAGLSIGFSVVAEAVLHTHLPDAPWRPLVENLGYCVGFLIVILAHQQLFTENTLTAVLPFMAEPGREKLLAVIRLWVIVFAANGIGTFLFAAFATWTPAIGPDVFVAMLDMSRHMMENSWWEMLVRGIVAGWLIAAVVWIMPTAEGAEFWVITVLTYLIAAGDFTHVVAGSVEAFLLVFQAELSIVDLVLRFTVPVFIGNVIGGTVLFAMISYAQVMEEIEG